MKKLFMILGAPLAILSVVGLLSLMGIPMAATGFLHPKKPVEAAAKPTGPGFVDFRATPAGELMASVFRALDKEGKPSGVEVNAAGLPHPLACVEPTAPLSDSKAYRLKGTDVQVTLSAYPAGLGDQVFSRLKDTVASCKPTTTSITSSSVDGLGVEAERLTAVWGVNRIETTYFRRGDMVAFVATDLGKDSRARAKLVDKLISERMTKTVCADQKAGAASVKRNAFFAGKDFTGLRQAVALATKKVSEPELTRGQLQAGIKKVNPKTEVPALKRVERPSDAFAYPLWPRLPKKVDYPEKPKTPAKQKLEAETWKRVADPVGPGCGWNFLTTVEPTYDADVVTASNEAREAAAQKALNADGKRWQAATVAYWTEYAEFLSSISAYERYSDEVKAVDKAWDAIHDAWDAYYTDFANWENYMADRAAFIQRKDAAKAAYEAQADRCEDLPATTPGLEAEISDLKDQKRSNDAGIPALKKRIQELEAKDEASQDDGDPSTVEGPPLTSAEEDELESKRDSLKAKQKRSTSLAGKIRDRENKLDNIRKELREKCPARKDSILSEKTPAKKDEPKKPADPRPVSER